MLRIVPSPVRFPYRLPPSPNLSFLPRPLSVFTPPMPRSLSQHPDAICSRERRAAARSSPPSTTASVRASPDVVWALHREVVSSDRRLARQRVVSDARLPSVRVSSVPLPSRFNPVPPVGPPVAPRHLLSSARLEDGGYSLNFIASYRPDPIDNS